MQLLTLYRYLIFIPIKHSAKSELHHVKTYFKVYSSEGSLIGTATIIIPLTESLVERDTRDLAYHTYMDNCIRPCIYLDRMDREGKDGKNHGAAIFEAVFRLSLLLKCEGRIKLEGVRDTALFYHKQGVRPTIPGSNYLDNHYSRLSVILLDNPGKKITTNMGAIRYYLPYDQIKNLINKFNIDYNLPDFITEDNNEKIINSLGDKIIKDSLAGGLCSRILYALAKDRYLKVKSSNPRLFKGSSNSFFTDAVKFVFDCLSEYMVQQSPPPDLLAIHFVGSIILAMTCYDRDMRHKNIDLLYPGLNIDILEKNPQELGMDDRPDPEDVLELIHYLGNKALIEHTLPFDSMMYKKILPTVSGLNDLNEMIEQLSSSSNHHLTNFK